MHEHDQLCEAQARTPSGQHHLMDILMVIKAPSGTKSQRMLCKRTGYGMGASTELMCEAGAAAWPITSSSQCK